MLEIYEWRERYGMLQTTGSLGEVEPEEDPAPLQLVLPQGDARVRKPRNWEDAPGTCTRKIAVPQVPTFLQVYL